MKPISAIALFTIATLAAATSLVAQQPAVAATIPFNFTVGDHSMPAGDYIISSPASHLVKIVSADRREVAFALGSHSFHEAQGTPKLVFDRYGELYFLHRILSPGDAALNLDVVQGKPEKRVQRREASLQTMHEILIATR